MSCGWMRKRASCRRACWTLARDDKVNRFQALVKLGANYIQIFGYLKFRLLAAHVTGNCETTHDAVCIVFRRYIIRQWYIQASGD